MYDAIVVGARCAGSPTAMLLARRGYRVLLLDKASFPSDTMSTHVIWPQGCEALDRWGLYDELAATGCPPIALNMKFDVGPFAITGGVREGNRGRGGLGPRRTILDKLLVDAAVKSGAELRETFTVKELLWDGNRVVGIRGHARNGATVEERAKIVIGADGVHSFVAKAVEAPAYDTNEPLVAAYYSYFSGIDCTDFENYVLPNEGAGLFPTHDNLTSVITGWKSARFKEVRGDIDGNVKKVQAKVPGLLERLASAKQEEPWTGTAGVPNYFRKPYGPGWALVGDAGYERDFVTAQGISDAFLDAEALTQAIDEGFAGRRPLDDALADFEASRNQRVMPMYQFTLEIASLEPPSPELQALLDALRGNQDASDQFFAATTGSLPLPVFMDPANVAKIMMAAGARG